MASPIRSHPDGASPTPSPARPAATRRLEAHAAGEVGHDGGDRTGAVDGAQRRGVPRHAAAALVEPSSGSTTTTTSTARDRPAPGRSPPRARPRRRRRARPRAAASATRSARYCPGGRPTAPGRRRTARAAATASAAVWSRASRVDASAGLDAVLIGGTMVASWDAGVHRHPDDGTEEEGVAWPSSTCPVSSPI